MKKLVSGSIGLSLIGTGLLFATPAYGYNCLNLDTYEYVVVEDFMACVELHNSDYVSTPVSTPDNGDVDEDVYTDPTPTPDAPAEQEVDVVEALKDDPYGQEVIVTKDGEMLAGTVTAAERSDLQDEGYVVQAATDVSINYSWGIDRVNQADLPLDDYADYAGKGSGVEVYIIDTGIDWTHSNFSNVSRTGFDYIGGDRFPGYPEIEDGEPTDCHGHGTHVAGTTSSRDYGIAPESKVIGVRVLGCSGSGSTAGVISGLAWVEWNKQQRPDVPMVANLSLGGAKNSLLNEAVADLVDAGVIVVVAAGNESTLASSKSPASEPKAITVGSTTSTDSISYFSNYGSMVDILAPGSSIKSTARGGGYTTMSGTSMAAPHVAGIAAGYLGDGGSASGFDAWLKSNAVSAISHTRSSTTFKLAQYNVAANPNPEPEPEPTPTPTPTPTPEPPPVGQQPSNPPPAPAPAPPSGGGGGSAPAPAPAPEPIVEVPPVWVPPTAENPITIQQQPSNETVTTQPRTVEKVGKKTVVTLQFDSDDYTSIRTFKWNAKTKKWKRVRYVVRFDDGIQMSFKKKGRYKVVGVNLSDNTRETLLTFKVKKVKK